mmetsp:Transcript_25461/g.21341  ORF Transcript_25461/g.21341 Transcript_25461/m.21341 type:complete len:85 (-) Transcript_25461:234-488(-)
MIKASYILNKSSVYLRNSNQKLTNRKKNCLKKLSQVRKTRIDLKEILKEVKEEKVNAEDKEEEEETVVDSEAVTVVAPEEEKEA